MANVMLLSNLSGMSVGWGWALEELADIAVEVGKYKDNGGNESGPEALMAALIAKENINTVSTQVTVLQDFLNKVS